jgi:integrase
MSGLHRHAKEYLAIRRTLGFKLRGHDRLLEDFVDYLDEIGTGTITAETAMAWATRPADVQPVRWAQRLCAVRGFARYLHGLDPAIEVPSVDLLPARRQRPLPYLYSQTDIARLVEAATALRPALRAATHETLFGLLAVTGMRIGEAIALDRNDVDLEAGTLHITDAKFRKHRRLPLHRSSVMVLRRYAELRDELCLKPKGLSFFVSTRGTRLLGACVREVFRKLVDCLDLGIQPGAHPPRVHGLRHAFAVATLRDWYRSGTDVAGHLPVLSAYLGHTHPASTYWYLQACPELLGLAAERLERSWGSSR